ncbi:MAG TPA: lysylphosphatidylglycerol synthase domain-containing protein [Gemmatimonadaceae bacterium]|nr:lysylphosphatidylglycerol synthase domain-containing protein [Gemmatimonadaceae bacterium]
MNDGRRKLLRVGRALVVAAVLWFVVRELVRQWRAVAGQPLGLDLHWGYLALASAIVLATYALLIQLWRLVLHFWGARLSLADAIRIWCISNLGRYVPGRVWQIGAMAALARERGVSPVAATGSALLNTAINIATGMAIALITGREYLERLLPGGVAVATALTVAAIVGLLALPWMLPRVMRMAASRTGATGIVPHVPPGAVWLTAAGNALAWVLYGVAFQLFVAGALGHAAGGPVPYMAVYAGSYVVGYLAIFTPGGLGVREVVMAAGLTSLGLATAPQALLLGFASRLWLTVLEVVPGLLFLAFATGRRSRPSTSPRDVTS